MMRLRLVRSILIAVTFFSFGCVHANATCLTITSFKVANSNEVSDLNDFSVNFPEMLRQALDFYAVQVRVTPEYLSFDASIDPKYAVFQSNVLEHAERKFGCRYVVGGELISAGNYEHPMLFGLWSRTLRAFDLRVRLYDTKSKKMIKEMSYASYTRGDSQIGKQHAFGSAGFMITEYGKAIKTASDNLAEKLQAELKLHVE